MEKYIETHHDVTIHCNGLNATDENIESILERFDKILDENCGDITRDDYEIETDDGDFVVYYTAKVAATVTYFPQTMTDPAESSIEYHEDLYSIESLLQKEFPDAKFSVTVAEDYDKVNEFEDEYDEDLDDEYWWEQYESI